MACLAGDLVHVSRGPNFPRDGTDNGDHGPHNPYAGLILTATPRWVRGVAWSILGGSGPLDSGSNPDGPIFMEGRSTDFRKKVSTPVPLGRASWARPFSLC